MRSLIKKFFLFAPLTLLTGCGQMLEVVYCDYGYGAVENKFYGTGAKLLSQCLNLDSLSTDERATYLQGRAWAYFNIDEYEPALADQHAAFELRPPTQHFEFINHAAYLRSLQRFHESLRALKKAQSIDEAKGRASMVTQYNLGWIFYELGRFDEAIAAISRGLPLQSDYAFAYLRRGLAYHKQGKDKRAREDFTEFLELVGEQQVNIPSALKKELSELPSEYDELRNL
jgi:tetratricopeptide (TPR) repeat protein